MTRRGVAFTIVAVAASFASSPAKAQPLVLQPVASVPSPLGIVNAGDGSNRLFLVSQAGLIYIHNGNQLLAAPFLDISTKILAGGERGLLGLAFHPSYATNGFFFVNYTRNNGDTVVARYRVSQSPNLANPDSEVILFVQSQPASNHNGGQMQFGLDGKLYIALGDGGGFAARNNSQSLGSLLGKILRIDVDNINVQQNPPYGIPANNPFFNTSGARKEIWALGLRNPWRFSFDRQTGDLYVADVGETSLEEVNFQAAASQGGQNYGWPIMEGTSCLAAGNVNCTNGSLTTPFFEYGHSIGCSITGGYVYRGASYSALQGSYFFGDFCTGRIWRAIRNGSNWSVGAPTSTTLKISSFGEDENGDLYVADLTGGMVYRIQTSRSATTGVFRPSNGAIYLKNKNESGIADIVLTFGLPGDKPLAGDWDNDGDDTIGVFRNGTFYLRNSNSNGFASLVFAYGLPSDLPVVGDWNGDGTDTVGVYRDGLFLLRDSNSSAPPNYAFHLGIAGDIPIAGDWDGDGIDTVGVFRPSTGALFLKNANSTGFADIVITYGKPGDKPVTGDWDGNGTDTVGVFRDGLFLLRNTNTDGFATLVFSLGIQGDEPIAGRWGGP